MRYKHPIETIEDFLKWSLFISGELKRLLPFSEDDIKILTAGYKDGFKKCRKCGLILPATEGYFDSYCRSPDGLRYQCKDCRRKYNSHYTKIRREEEKGEMSPEYIAEVNRVRALDGQPPLHIPEHHPHKSPKKRGRPRKEPKPLQLAPKPGEAW